MSKRIVRDAFFAELRTEIASHCEIVSEHFQPLADDALTWQPSNKKGQPEWSILQCFEHLNLTHDYYMAKIAGILASAPQAHPVDDHYKASFWGGIYMYFALNPKYTFPSPEPVTPNAQPNRQVLAAYLARQEELLQCFAAVTEIDLRKTMVPIEKFVRFNLGDCLKILVYHDQLHIGQAQRVYDEMARSSFSTVKA